MLQRVADALLITAAFVGCIALMVGITMQALTPEEVNLEGAMVAIGGIVAGFIIGGVGVVLEDFVK